VNKAGVADLKAHLSRYLERVKGGEEVIVTERGVPVAKLVPLRAAERRDSRRERLARAGLLRLGAGKIRASFLRVPKGPPVGASVVQALLNERRQGR
jgi:prevent-host-death family protein